LRLSKTRQIYLIITVLPFPLSPLTLSFSFYHSLKSVICQINIHNADVAARKWNCKSASAHRMRHIKLAICVVLLSQLRVLLSRHSLIGTYALWSTFLWEGEKGERITRLTDIAKIASFVQYHVQSRVLNFERSSVTIVVFYVVVFLMSTSLFIDNINRKIVNKHIETIMNLTREKFIYTYLHTYIYIYIYICTDARKEQFCWSTDLKTILFGLSK